jgi:oxygen-independent coproporphyrinogen-3 oxidase
MMSKPPTPADASRNVPRYTSYPTAPHFHARVDAPMQARWIADVPAGSTLSLYLHVPFCTQLCHYCGCNTKVAARQEPIERYAGLLMREIDLASAMAGSRRVTHIHWGGGTPSALTTARLQKVFEHIAAKFDLSGLRDHAMELDPRHVDRSLVATLSAIGVNRASLGVQDFTPRVQHAMGRIQPYDVVAQSITLLHSAGIDRLNLDLMYGLPTQTTDDVLHSAVLAASFNPSRIALFGYAHVPWFKKHQRLIDESTLPGLDARIEQARSAAETLCDLAYRPVGMDHFADPDDDLAIAAREGRLRRNFQGYTADDADVLLAFGPSAISRFAQGFVQNSSDLAGYGRSIAAGQLAGVRGIALNDEDRMRSAIIERLMCDLAVDLRPFAGEDGSRVRFASEFGRLEQMHENGLVDIDGDRVVVTEYGRPFARIVAAAFDSYLSASGARHSIAV